MKTNRIIVEYTAAGGHPGRWRSGTGRFSTAAPAAAVENEALRRARRRLGHTAVVTGIRITREGDRP